LAFRIGLLSRGHSVLTRPFNIGTFRDGDTVRTYICPAESNPVDLLDIYMRKSILSIQVAGIVDADKSPAGPILASGLPVNDLGLLPSSR
jgi:hypothetical protein